MLEVSFVDVLLAATRSATAAAISLYAARACEYSGHDAGGVFGTHTNANVLRPSASG